MWPCHTKCPEAVEDAEPAARSPFPSPHHPDGTSAAAVNHSALTKDALCSIRASPELSPRSPRHQSNTTIHWEFKKKIRREEEEEEEENSPLLLCGLLSCQAGLCAIDSHSVVFSDAKRRRGVVDGVGWEEGWEMRGGGWTGRGGARWWV